MTTRPTRVAVTPGGCQNGYTGNTGCDLTCNTPRKVPPLPAGRPLRVNHERHAELLYTTVVAGAPAPGAAEPARSGHEVAEAHNAYAEVRGAGVISSFVIILRLRLTRPSNLVK